MKFSFEKWHGAGNDFILIDNRQMKFPAEQKTIAQWCHRRLGIGADGLILVQNHPDFDFEMIYYNADGKLGSMCGNGGRCAVIFAKQLGIIRQSATFMAFDGVHHAVFTRDDIIKLSMNTVNDVKENESYFILDTGSPHYVKFVDSVAELDMVAEGKKIRYSKEYREKGINVNFVQVKGEELWMRTYERGVEDETLSCGTGTVAAAIAAAVKLKKVSGEQSYPVHALGGDLVVYFKREAPNLFAAIYLEGPVAFVYRGEAEI